MAEPTKAVDVADSCAVWLMQYLVVPTFVPGPGGSVVV